MAALVASIYRGISYRGAEGQWAWILHRASGLGIVLFLYMHIVSIFIAAIGPGPYEWVHATLYTSPPAKVRGGFSFRRAFQIHGRESSSSTFPGIGPVPADESCV